MAQNKAYISIAFFNQYIQCVTSMLKNDNEDHGCWIYNKNYLIILW